MYFFGWKWCVFDAEIQRKISQGRRIRPIQDVDLTSSKDSTVLVPCYWGSVPMDYSSEAASRVLNRREGAGLAGCRGTRGLSLCVMQRGRVGGGGGCRLLRRGLAQPAAVLMPVSGFGPAHLLKCFRQEVDHGAHLGRQVCAAGIDGIDAEFAGDVFRHQRDQ